MNRDAGLSGPYFYRTPGVPTHLEYPSCRVDELVLAAALRYGERSAIIDGDARLTFSQLSKATADAVTALREGGVTAGDTVLIAQPNGAAFVLDYLAVSAIGAVAVLLSPLAPKSSLLAHIRMVRATVAILAGPVASLAEDIEVRRVLRTVITVNPGGGHTVHTGHIDAAYAARPVAPGAPAQRVAHLGFTGGTTGEPKAVRVLHRNVIANIVQLCAWRTKHGIDIHDGELRLTPFGPLHRSVMTVGDGRALFVPPLFHAHALINLWFLLVCGVTVDMVARFNVADVLRKIQNDRVTYLTGSPGMWQQLLDAPELPDTDVSSVTVASSGGAPMPPQTTERLLQAFPGAVFSETYGMTEATLAVTAGPLGIGEPRPIGTAGAPLPDTRIQLRPVSGCPMGDGEIWVSGPQITPGYLDAPEATAEQFVDGWLRTGDLGHVDQQGFLVVTGRVKDVILYNGYSVFPRELEEIILTLPGVAEVAVVGAPHPSSGEIPVAFVVPATGVALTAETIMSHVAASTVPYKKVRDVVIVDRLPRTPAGKVAKEVLRAQRNH